MSVMSQIHADLDELRSDKDAAWDHYETMLATYAYEKRSAEQWREIEKAHECACYAKHKYDVALAMWE